MYHYTLRCLHTKAADAGGTARRPNPPAVFCTIMPPACARAGKPAGQHADADGIPLHLLSQLPAGFHRVFDAMPRLSCRRQSRSAWTF
ncbi:hypothetical protein B5X24_HaOG205939 [Helicoverpa armigera]|uniref:Uncharacterized protein n=1 Tax=Helicoverpa armigera TaxID=29058 RepID=A0A2W1BS33_HELAM|nr:hypothetical protein B5X24_HaOG205939 [Helicoverpa armigera]